MACMNWLIQSSATEELSLLQQSRQFCGRSCWPTDPACSIHAVPVQIPSLLTGTSLCKEVAMLAELLVPIANPKLAATFRKALTDMFSAATQVTGTVIVYAPLLRQTVFAAVASCHL